MTTADVLGLASLAVALVALVVSGIAIRRDRAYLVVRAADAAAGSRFTTVVNVGLRPVRVVYVVTRPHRWWVWVTPTDMTGLSRIVGIEDGGNLPVVLHPAAEVVLSTPNPAMLGLPVGPFAVIDASGRIHWPAWRSPRLVAIPPREGPEDRDDTVAS